MIVWSGLSTRWLMVAAIATALAGARAANAATFVVTSTADDSDAMPGDGLCLTAHGVCTLRAAVQEANALSGADAVTLPRGTYRLTAGELAITDDLVLSGAGREISVISNSRRTRVMSIASGATVSITGVRLQRGRADVGAGLLNNGSATLSAVAFTGNHAARSAGGFGGAVDNAGTLTLRSATFTNNRATGALGAFGGGVYNSGTLTLTDVVFTGNISSGCGGAVFNEAGALSVTRAGVIANHAGNSGGGIFNQTGNAQLTDTTLARNSAKGIGGGFYTYGPATLTNITVSRNRAGYGGGLFAGPNTTTLANVTINNNRAYRGGGIYCDGTALLHNTLVALNRPENCNGRTVTSAGHNLDSGTTCGLGATGDLSTADPTLGSLHNNGGATQTCALLVGSPAIDAGDNDGCPATDQRGAPRPAGPAEPRRCDIGAYETQP